jgi:UDP-N-acetylmuramate: L-alanyl-gamma-D-glutamyl-meso-diaminopimelate ligase
MNATTNAPDMRRNRIPDSLSTVHLIAVCGTGMGALAGMLKDLGFIVTGSDQSVYPPMSDFLAHKGIEVYRGFDPDHLAHGPDLVVVGNAVSRDNPEVRAMIAAGFNFCSMPQALNRLVVDGRRRIVITGTHGKTTTSAMMAWVLQAAGYDPGFMIGGILRNFDSNYRIGKGPYFVLEGDEYDTAFFDKGPKFLHYPPAVAMLTGVEFDHADIYRDLAHVRQSFERFVGSMTPESTLLAVEPDPVVDALLGDARCRVVRYGTSGAGTWKVSGRRSLAPWSQFDVERNGAPFGTYQCRLMGSHNQLNALAVVGAAEALGIDVKMVQTALETFEGVRRRQEIRGQAEGVTIIDDFAHHPTAVRETLQAVRSFYPRHRLIAVFEPRSNTSMRNVFQDVYPGAFTAADMICIRQPSMLHKVPEGQRFSSAQLVADLQRQGKDARYFDDTDGIIAFLAAAAVAGDVILVMSNGGFDNIHERLLEALQRRGSRFKESALPDHGSGAGRASPARKRR